MQRLLSKLTYANVVATLALCIALGGGAAFAAGKIGSGQIADGGVHTKNLQQRSVTSGKLAVGAVRSNQIAPHAVSTEQIAAGAVRSAQIADGAVGGGQIAKGAVGSAQLGKEAIGSADIGKGSVGSAQIADGAVGAAQMQFPVTLAANPTGGSIAVPVGGVVAYPLTGATWTPRAGSVDLATGTVTADLPPSAGPGGCVLRLQFATGEGFSSGPIEITDLINGSTTESAVTTKPLPVFPLATEPSPGGALAVRALSFGCAAEPTIESTDLRVIEFG